jgi:hypothetical protein
MYLAANKQPFEDRQFLNSANCNFVVVAIFKIIMAFVISSQPFSVGMKRLEVCLVHSIPGQGRLD